MQNFWISLALIDWLNNNYWWPVILFLASLIIIIKIMLIQPQKKSSVDGSRHTDEIIVNLGGIDNIESVGLDGNRIKFSLKEIESANLQAFKDLGATGVFISGKNVKMVLPFSTKPIVDKINSDINGGKL
jgi:phosphotransferase system IIB component